LGDEVTGNTIAIVGTGRIGQAMIRKCLGLDMKILCYDPGYRHGEFIEKMQAAMEALQQNGLQSDKTWIQYESFENCMKHADFVSVHVPLIREGEGLTPTHHLFNEKTFRLMKPTAYFINTSRGPVVDEAGL